MGKNILLGTKIKHYRKIAGLTQEELAKKVGVSRIYIQYIEAGKRVPSLKRLKRIAEVLGADLSELVGGLPPKQKVRLKMEELFSPNAEFELWYKDRCLGEKEKRLIKRIIEATLMEWELEKDE